MAIPNIYQSVDEIIKNSSAEQRVIWQQIRLITGENASVQQFYYCGPIAGTEFLTYSVNKLYFAFNCKFGYSSVNLGASGGNINIFNEANVASMYLQNTFAIWNATGAAPNFGYNLIDVNNIYFSRILQSQYTYMSFTGVKFSY